MNGLHKRRKVKHIASEEDLDNASFASFSDSEERLADEVNGSQGKYEDARKSVDGNGIAAHAGISAHNSNAVDDGPFEDDEDQVGDDEDQVVDDDEGEENDDEEEDSHVSEMDSKGSGTQRALENSQPSNGSSTHPKQTVGRSRLKPNAYEPSSSKNSIFKIKVDELLYQIRPKHTRREVEAEDCLHALKKTIESIPDRGPFTAVEAQRILTKEKVTVPFPEPRPPEDANYKFEYARPTSINVVGSHPLKTANRSRKYLYIDMVVQMPSCLFQEKDFLNYRYFYKRSFYLACIASAIQLTNSQQFEIKFQHHHDDPLRPVIVIRPVHATKEPSSQKPATKWQVNIHTSVPHDLFSTGKLLLESNCVRPRKSSGNNDAIEVEPTSFYNSSLRADMLVTSYLKLLHQSSVACESYRDACVLGSVWLRQRGLRASSKKGGFGSFEWNALLALLLLGGGPSGKPLLNGRYSSYQILKATFQLLANRNLVDQPLNIGSGTDAERRSKNVAPVVWDAARAHNILYKMSPWSYELLRVEARTTLAMLNDPDFDGFEATFIVKKNHDLMRIDFLLEVDDAELSKSGASLDHKAFEQYTRLYNILREGLGDRVTLITMTADRSEPWHLDSTRPSINNRGSIRVGVVVNPETVNRTVDQGPRAEEKAEAARFRQFWGEKAELRRFKDGSILESLIWNQDAGGPSILEQIIRCLLRRHFSVALEESTCITADLFASMLRPENATAWFRSMSDAYKKLERDIRDLESLPLPIRQIAPSDPQLCSASMTVHGNRKATQGNPANVVMQFESSGRWPDELVAIQRTKIAFLLRIGTLLQESVDSVTTRIGLENQERDMSNQGFLDVLYETGPAFRIRIYHDREQTLIERRLKDKSLDPKTKELLAAALATFRRDNLRGPAHTQAIAQLCTRHPALSGTIRVLKKWFASHLLFNHIAENVIELFAARTFVQPWPWQTPSSVQTGFLRAIAWLAKWDWRFEPIIVDLSVDGDLRSPEISAIRTRFEAWRKLDPALNRVVLFVASSVDPEGTTYTDGTPSKVVAGRMTALARAAFAQVESQGVRIAPLSLFVSPLNDFDFVLHLNTAFLGSGRQRKAKDGTVYKNLELGAALDVSAVGFNPVSDFLSDLQSAYGSAILTFSGFPERPVIGGLWIPHTAPKAWKVNLAYSTTPLKQARDEGVVAETNKPAMLAEISRLGGDLVERIEWKKV